MIYIVLGMHKSGTTLVSQLLHQSGVDMGTFDGGRGYDEGNVYERVEAQRLNQRLLEGVLEPVLEDRLRRRLRPHYTYDGRLVTAVSIARVSRRPIEPSSDVEIDMKRLVADLGARFGDWGFKDPRTCLTYPVWHRILPPHRVIVVYRDYRDLMRRWPRHPWRLRRLLVNWAVYNERALEAVELGEPHLVLRYGALMAGGDALARLSAFVGRPLVDVRRPELYRNRAGATRSGVVAGLVLTSLESRLDGILGRLDAAAGHSAQASSAAAPGE